MATALKYFTVYFLSTLKFVFGPAFGVVNNLPVVAIIILTSLGMMTTIYLFTFFGDKLREFLKNFFKKNKKFTKRNRQFIIIRNKFGLKGLCLLTPLVLTPPGGGLIMSLLNANKRLMLRWMWISALGWSTIITLTVKYAFHWVKDFI